MKRRRLCAMERRAADEMLRAGMSCTVIAEHLACSVQVVRNRARRINLAAPRGRPPSLIAQTCTGHEIETLQILARAYEHGRFAFSRGISIKGHPFHGDVAEMFAIGWRKAKKEKENDCCDNHAVLEC